MDLFAQKYRIASARLPGYDYAQPGKYFVTICTKNRIHWFGEIRNGIMGLNDMGCVVADEIEHIAILRHNVSIDRWVVMPNHIHMIVFIHPETYVDGMMKWVMWKIFHIIDRVETPLKGVSTTRARCIGTMRNTKRSHAWHPHTLGAIINQFKRACTIRIRSLGEIDFTWQNRFHEKIIWDRSRLYAYRKYIKQNPARWHRDRNNN